MRNQSLQLISQKSVFPAMGNTAHVIVVTDGAPHGDALIATAQTRLAQLEALWSRFIPSSEVSQLNASANTWVPISSSTALLLRHLLEAFRATEGLFNPFLLPALIRAGYSQSMSDPTHEAVGLAEGSTWKASATDVELRHVNSLWEARLINGATLDPGALGKGLAADIVAEQLFALGAMGVLVNVGGDLRCIGTPGDSTAWQIEVEAINPESPTVATVLIPSGGVATSTTFAKRWQSNGVMRHHVLNPVDGEPLTNALSTSLRASSVIASSAVWAEVFATALLVGGSIRGMQIIEQNGLAARGEYVNGSNIQSRQWSSYNAIETDKL